jgi:hypothetical protein
MRPDRDRPWTAGVLAAILACVAVTPAGAGVCPSCGSGGSSGGSGGSLPPPPSPPTVPAASGFVSVIGSLDSNPSYSQYSTLPGGALGQIGADGRSATSATLTLGSDPSAAVTARASAALGEDVNAQAQVYYTYAFVVGGPAGVSVPVDVSGLLTATEAGGGPYAYAGADIIVQDTNTGTGVTGWTEPAVCAAVGTSCALGGSDTVSQTIDVTVGDVITVYLDAYVDVTDYVAGTSIDATASIDPTFQIDPTFLATNSGYTLTYGQGVLAVPEPDAWCLMLAGLGFAGLAVRRRRRDWGSAGANA